MDNHRIHSNMKKINNFFEITEKFVNKSHQHIRTLVNMVNDLIESDEFL